MMPSATEKVYIIRDKTTGEEVHRITTSAVGGKLDRFELGLILKTDERRYWIEWPDDA